MLGKGDDERKCGQMLDKHATHSFSPFFTSVLIFVLNLSESTLYHERKECFLASRLFCWSNK